MAAWLWNSWCIALGAKVGIACFTCTGAFPFSMCQLLALPACCAEDVQVAQAQQEVRQHISCSEKGTLSCLRKLPAAESLSPELLADLLGQALQRGAASNTLELLEFPAAQQISAARMQQLLLAAGTRLDCLFTHSALEQLLQLPGAQAMVSSAAGSPCLAPMPAVHASAAFRIIHYALL